MRLARGIVPLTAAVDDVAIRLYASAMQAALWLIVPSVGAVAIVGIAVGILQTVVQVQDQNVSFLPKLIAVAALAVLFGVTGLSMLVHLMGDAIAALPQLAGH